MPWKSGWLLAELDRLLARFPNTPGYPELRMQQLRLFNRAGRYEDALAIMWDANLPGDDLSVWLERGLTAMGLARSRISQKENWRAAQEYLEKVRTLTGNKGDVSAEANHLLARLAQERGKGAEAVTVLDQLTPAQEAYIANNPQRLMEIADIYYRNRRHEQAVALYSKFLSHYPGLKAMGPWALLRAAESSYQLGQQEGGVKGDKLKRVANLLFERLREEHPKSDAAVWGRIFRLRLETHRGVKERLAQLEKVIATIALPEALAEALITKSELLGQSKQYRAAMETLNKLLTLTSRKGVVDRASRLKRDFLAAGMAVELSRNQPESAVLLAAVHGEDWRNQPGYEKAQAHLVEALMRMGMWDKALSLTKGADAEDRTGLTHIGEALNTDDWSHMASRPNQPDGIPTKEARVRLAEAAKLVDKKAWERVLKLLEPVDGKFLDESGRMERLRLLARAEEGRGRFFQAVPYLEDLLFGRPLGSGMDYYWYATVLQRWKKDDARVLLAFQLVAKEAENKEIQALALIRIGDIMRQSDNLQQAREHYQQAEKLVPGSAWAQVAAENVSQLDMVMGTGQ